eukprot:840039-Prorocentrum_minimum.AAC.1
MTGAPLLPTAKGAGARANFRTCLQPPDLLRMVVLQFGRGVAFGRRVRTEGSDCAQIYYTPRFVSDEWPTAP